ncbi:MAG: bifunctional nuclease family protein [Candidatus Marinimicrobia bacterium]|nr:bifunctional nuclease family protein [Candidatus Neomarinimicrobiota bacterium]MBL7067041.1 bifunctional nuclease family protein [Candidatus Neomarinimicrobiota bacterium]
MIRVNLDKIIFYPPSKGYAIILKEIDGNRQLPVIVGVFEAQSIALALQQVKMPRPMTHDLFVRVLTRLGASVQEVVINDLIDGTFYAKITLKNKHDQFLVHIDSRPSDAIAIALRVDADIIVSESVMEEAGQLLNLPDLQKHPLVKEAPTEDDLLDRLIELKTKLQIAIDDENYELAAKLRDQISSLEKESKNN